MKKGFVLLMFWITPRCQGWTTVSGTAFPSCLDYLPRSQEFIDALSLLLWRERCVCCSVSDVQKASLLKGRKSLGGQTFTQKRLVSIWKELFAGETGRTGLQQNHEQS